MVTPFGYALHLRPSALGEHSRDVMGEVLGYPQERVAELLARLKS